MLSLKPNVLYVRFDADTISVRASHSGQAHAERAALALRADSAVVAVGESVAQAMALNPALHVAAPFAHPRLLLVNYAAAEKLAASCIAKLKRPMQVVKPYIIIHPLRAALDDLTQPEMLACMVLSMSLGSCQPYVWVGRPLGEEEQRLLQFPASEGRVFNDFDAMQRSTAAL